MVERGLPETKANGHVGPTSEVSSPAPGLMWHRSRELEAAFSLDCSPRSPVADKCTSTCKDEGTQCEEGMGDSPGGLGKEQQPVQGEGNSQQQQPP
eukprot:scaffold46042_cov21-Tisochrysis_lutea.AAC.3